MLKIGITDNSNIKHKFSIPENLHEITLGKRIEYETAVNNQYNQKLKERQEYIQQTFGESANIDECIARIPKDIKLNWEIEYIEHVLKTLSFFSNIPQDVLQACEIDSILQVFEKLKIKVLNVDLKENEVISEILKKGVFTWNKKDWVINTDVLIHSNNPVTLGQYVEANHLKILESRLANGYLDTLPYLCALFIREKGSEFKKENLPKMASVFNDLPLSYAVAVAFFLTNYVQT